MAGGNMDEFLNQPLLQNDAENSMYDSIQSQTTDSTSFSKTVFNGLNALSGVGILSVPYALSSGGWGSLPLLFAVSMAAFYAGLLIKRCMELDPTINCFIDIGDRAFGTAGRILVAMFMCAELYLVVTGFLIVEGDNLYNLFPNMNINFFGIHVIIGKKWIVILVAVFITPSVWYNDYNYLSYISATGVLASFVIILSVFYVGAFGGIGFQHKGEFFNWSGIPTSASLYGFCYCAHPVFPNLYNSMEKKHDFTKVLIICFVWMTFSYSSIAILGYLMFGSRLYPEITLNLPTNKISSQVAIFTTLISPLSKYALMLDPVIIAVESWFPVHHNKRFKFMIRTIIIITQVIVALYIPFFGRLVSLVGAFLSVTASITLPCLCYLKIAGNNLGYEKVLVVGVIISSLLIAIFGTYTSLVQLIYGVAMPI
ncbi:unnamed protein product [Amaranthus hypochondriacus]